MEAAAVAAEVEAEAAEAVVEAEDVAEDVAAMAVAAEVDGSTEVMAAAVAVTPAAKKNSVELMYRSLPVPSAMMSIANSKMVATGPSL